MRYPKLDDRLQAAADLFPNCRYGADIGADHGRLSCYLLYSGKCDRMLVSDISAESLSKAQALLTLHDLADRADFCTADGLDALKGHADISCTAICGMGGRLISRILLDGKDTLNGTSLVLSAHTDVPLVRQTLAQIGYTITAERIVRAKRRFYVLMRAKPGPTGYDERDLYLGPLLVRDEQPLWKAYLKWREGVVACEAGHDQQLAWIREELAK